MSRFVKRRAANTTLNLPDSMHPLLRRVYSQRNVKDAEELELGLEKLILPEQLKGINEAVQLLIDALQRQQRVLIVADFDADGATQLRCSSKGPPAIWFSAHRLHRYRIDSTMDTD